MTRAGGAYDIKCTGDNDISAGSGSQSCWCQYNMCGLDCQRCHRPYVDANTPTTRKHWICAECWPAFCWSKWGTRPCNGDGCQHARQLNIASRHESDRQRAAANMFVPVPGPPLGGPPPPGLGTIRTASVILTPGPYAACSSVTPTPGPIASMPSAQSSAGWYGQPSVQMQHPDQDAAGNAASSSSGMGGNPGATTTHQGPVSHQAKYARRGDSPPL